MPNSTASRVDSSGHGEQSESRSGRGRSRRAFLATGVAATMTAVAGCLGGTDGSGDGSSGGSGGTTPTEGDGTPTGSSTSSGGEPSPPWTTDALASHIDGTETLTIYAGTGDATQWYDLITVINEEFGTNIEGNVFASNGGKVSQRFLQERQAGEDKADLVSNASDIQDEIKINGPDAARPYFEWDMGQNFWFADVLPEQRRLPFMVGAFNGGAGSCLPLNEEIFSQRGLDYPTTYNDLFDEQYAGVETLLPGYIVGGEVGWIIDHHAEQTELSNMEWIQTLSEHLSFAGASSHTAAARAVAEGDAPMMFYNFPWVASPFVSDAPLRGHFVDPVKSNALAGPLSINRNAPNPWVARFFVSAMLEESVQRRMIHDVTDQVPVRLDIDYSPQNPDPFTAKRLDANTELIGFYDGSEYSTVGQRAKDNGAFEP